MGVLKRVWICSILLCASSCLVESCATQAMKDRINDIVTNLTSLQSTLPTNPNYSDPIHVGQYNALLNSLCTTYRPSLDEIAVTAASCFTILMEIPSLLSLEIAGKNFLQLYASFVDLDEFCSCSSHLMTAWAVEGMSPMLKAVDSNVPISPYAKLDIYCESTQFHSLVDALVAGASECPPLGKIAALVDNTRIAETKTFLNDKCSTFDKTKFECALTQSSSTNFKTCMNNPTSTVTSDSGDEAQKKRCGRRSCVKTNIESSCGASGRDSYITAVNLQRASADILIATEDCEENSATIVTMTTLSTLLVIVLHYII